MPKPLPPALTELTDRIGLTDDDLDDVERKRLTRALADATTLVLDEVTDATATRWTTAAPDVIELIVLKASRREYENPRGLDSETLGEHTVGLSETSGVYLTPRELAAIRRAATGGGSAGYTGSVRTPSAYGEARS